MKYLMILPFMIGLISCVDEPDVDTDDLVNRGTAVFTPECTYETTATYNVGQSVASDFDVSNVEVKTKVTKEDGQCGSIFVGKTVTKTVSKLKRTGANLEVTVDGSKDTATISGNSINYKKLSEGCNNDNHIKVHYLSGSLNEPDKSFSMNFKTEIDFGCSAYSLTPELKMFIPDLTIE